VVNQAIKILIVDDFPTMRKLLKNLLLQLGYSNVVEVEDGERALGCLSESEYDLILSDWDMPNLTGIQLLEEVRKNPRYAHIPFVMISAKSESDHKSKAKDLGCDAYITKPFTAETLKDKLSRVAKLNVKKEAS
jgi:two-component system chemotaxis response regulator CheY